MAEGIKMKKDTSEIIFLNLEKPIEKSLEQFLNESGIKVNVVNSLDNINTLTKTRSRIILADINGSSDMDLVKQIQGSAQNRSNIILLSDSKDIESQLDMNNIDVFDCFSRPVTNSKILSAIKRAMAIQWGCEKQLKAPAATAFYGLIGDSLKARDLYSIIGRVSSAKTTILIQGESGTGKRMIAQAIHKSDKKRKDNPFIEVSCAALPRDIIESELFGHTKGAFTSAIADRKGRFELADGGSILLDDIDAMPLDLQSKLLRIIQQKEFERVGDHKTIKVDARIIATTNQDIKKLVQEKKFREDLYYRINVISLNVPPLRERADDIPQLVNHFLVKYSKDNDRSISGISHDAMDALLKYSWPGNIRELENVIERAIILDIDNVIKVDDLPQILLTENIVSEFQALEAVNKFSASLKEAMQEPEKVHIINILKEVGGNKKEAAKKLGVNRTTLYNKLRKYNLYSQDQDKD